MLGVNVLRTNRLIIVSIIARISTGLADAVVLAVTVKTTFGGLKQAARVNMKVPVVHALLRDGELGYHITTSSDSTLFRNPLFPVSKHPRKMGTFLSAECFAAWPSV